LEVPTGIAAAEAMAASAQTVAPGPEPKPPEPPKEEEKMSEGKVQNISEEGKPKWVCLQEPPAEAMSMEVPERFAYKGDKAAPVKRQIAAPVQQVSVANVSGLTAKQQAALARKGGGKGPFQVAPGKGGGKGPFQAAPAAEQVIGGGGGGGSPVAVINEWAQKSNKALRFQEAGQDASGEFICQCFVDNDQVAEGQAGGLRDG